MPFETGRGCGATTTGWSTCFCANGAGRSRAPCVERRKATGDASPATNETDLAATQGCQCHPISDVLSDLKRLVATRINMIKYACKYLRNIS